MFLPIGVAISFVCSTGIRQDQFPDFIIPPSMVKRTIAKPTSPPPGRQIDLYGDGKYTLYIPPNWSATSKVTLTIHFHGAAWFAIDEHRARGLKEPLLAVYAGEGSTVYRRAFEDPDAWPRVLSHVLAELNAPLDATVERVDMTSFSAGYGAVRELLRQQDPPKTIRRILLADSMYASFTSDTDHAPLESQITPFVEFAKSAMLGKKGFVITCSLVPTEGYADSASCAKALVAAVGGSFRRPPFSPEMLNKLYPDYPLLTVFDQGGFHVWRYRGSDAMAHMTHPRHIADIWRAAWKD